MNLGSLAAFPYVPSSGAYGSLLIIALLLTRDDSVTLSLYSCISGETVNPRFSILFSSLSISRSSASILRVWGGIFTYLSMFVLRIRRNGRLFNYAKARTLWCCWAALFPEDVVLVAVAPWRKCCCGAMRFLCKSMDPADIVIVAVAPGGGKCCCDEIQFCCCVMVLAGIVVVAMARQRLMLFWCTRRWEKISVVNVFNDPCGYK